MAQLNKYAYTLAVALLFSILFWCLPSYYQESPPLQKISLSTRDLFFNLRRVAAETPEITKEIVIVAIDEESCSKLESRWPWSRNIFAQIVDKLTEAGAKVIGINVAFPGLEEGADASTQALAQALKNHGNVVIGSTVTA